MTAQEGNVAITQELTGHTEESRYMPPQEEAVKAALERFEDQKLGFMVHWGPYSQVGVYESWPLVDEDEKWSREDCDWVKNGEELRRLYFDLNRSFNPLRFKPEDWAQFALGAGFRYLIFTTKHHDGFCMYNTRETDYKVTDPACPFSSHPNANIAKLLFDAFRAKGLDINAYFSKPDWHCPWYWSPKGEKPIGHDRNPNYDLEQHRDLWQEFTRFVHAQMLELVRDLGPLQALWLDGGQVRPDNGQDIRMQDLAQAARAHTPGLLIADRTVGGPYENFITPEQQLPDHRLGVPWESCITIGTGFSYRYDDEYKSPRELVHLLLRVVSRGGNLALNLGAQPDGRLPKNGMKAALGLGKWLQENGEMIYATRACAPFEGEALLNAVSRPYALTQAKDGKTLYLALLLQEGDQARGSLLIKGLKPGSSACLLNSGVTLPVSEDPQGCLIELPDCGNPLALALRFLK